MRELPSWPTIPPDVPEAIRSVKRAIRERIEASGRSVGEVIARAEEWLADEVATVVEERNRGDAWPEVDFADIAARRIDDATTTRLRRRGCAVVRRTFDREQGERWDRDIVGYAERNRFFEEYRGPGDDFFSSVDSRPEIYPLYWSSAQMEARQHPNMATVQSFLNSLWRPSSDGVSWFDPDHHALYPDRIRRRPPGTDSGGLGPHLDPGTIDLWLSPGYQQAFRHLFAGDFDAYDPWDAAHRTAADQYPGSTMCSAFRTFQGWTALSDMPHDQGVLHTIPIPKAFGYLLLRPLLDDVDDDDLCGVRLNRAFPVSERWHSVLLPALSGIPDVEPGDTVWWHCDMIHTVAPVTDQQGWGNVMYIPAAPWCEKNARYASLVREAFETGRSPFDFPEEHYEASWPDRFHPDQLNALGRRGMGY